jgi:radical SAM-linked protein
VASEAEYLEIGLTRVCDPQEVCRLLDAALPPGLDIVEVVEARTPDFNQRLEASEWRVELRDVTPEEARQAVARLMGADEVQVERLTTDGVRRFDARGAVVTARVHEGEPVDSAESEQTCAILHLVVQHGTPAVRPDDVISALRLVADLVPPKPPRVTRLAQGPLTESGTAVADPLAPDRAG